MSRVGDPLAIEGACQTNGRGSSFQPVIQVRIEATSSLVERWLPLQAEGPPDAAHGTLQGANSSRPSWSIEESPTCRLSDAGGFLEGLGSLMSRAGGDEKQHAQARRRR